MRFKGAGAGLRSAGPGVAPILAEQPSDEDDSREHDTPNGPRDGCEALRSAVPVHDVGNIEQGHAASLASVSNCEDALQKPVEIVDGNHAAFGLERLVLGIPPAMGNACRKHGRLTSSHLNRRAPDDGAHHAGDYLTFFAFDQMNMQRRTFPFGRDAALEFEEDLIAVAHAAHDEDFAGVAVFQAKHAGCGTRKVSLPRRSAHLVRKDTQFSCPWRLRGVEGGRASSPGKSYCHLAFARFPHDVESLPVQPVDATPL